MTNITKTAQSILDELHAADLAYRNAKATEYRRAQREADERILAQKVNRDKLAAQARAQGASWARISDALGTKAARTAKDAVEHGLTLLPASEPKPVDVDPDRFAWDEESKTLTVTLTLGDVAPILEFSPFAAEDIESDPSLLTEEFVRDGDGWRMPEKVGPVSVLFFSPVHTDLLASAEAFVEGSAA